MGWLLTILLLAGLGAAAVVALAARFTSERAAPSTSERAAAWQVRDTRAQPPEQAPAAERSAPELPKMTFPSLASVTEPTTSAAPPEPPAPFAAPPAQEVAPHGSSFGSAPPLEVADRPGEPPSTGGVEPRAALPERKESAIVSRSLGRVARGDARLDCLPAALRSVLNDLSSRFGGLTVVSTTHLNTDNHSQGSVREKLHLDCKAVDFKTSGPVSEVMAYVRSRPEVGGINSYRNGVIHIDLNATFARASR